MFVKQLRRLGLAAVLTGMLISGIFVTAADAAAADKVSWFKDLHQGLASAKKSKKWVFVLVEASW